MTKRGIVYSYLGKMRIVVFMMIVFLLLYVYSEKLAKGSNFYTFLQYGNDDNISYKENYSEKSKEGSNVYTFLQYEDDSNIYNQEKQYNLRVIVIVYDRAHSLLRLLKSLNDAEYFSDLIKVEVWIDRSEKGTINEATLNTARNYVFKHGDYAVNLHRHHVGIYGQWFTTLKLNLNSSEIAVILEDDLTVSKYFWKYLKLVHQTYDDHKDINGYALQGITTTFGVENPHILQALTSDHVFLFPVVGAWGFSPNKRNWKQFIDWYKFGEARSTMPYIPGHLASEWFQGFIKKGKANTMWEIWHIYYASKHNEYTLYCNFPNHTGLTVNWREKGLHYGTFQGASNPLLTVWKKEYENCPKKPKYLHFSGKII